MPGTKLERLVPKDKAQSPPGRSPDHARGGHLKESMDYYQRLEVAEIEGDILKALVAKNLAKVETLPKKLVQAKLVLCLVESKQLG